jgi:DeoR/GlpR family transcriptional regulator of sugar metabolism
VDVDINHNERNENGMLIAERHSKIMARLADSGKVVVTDLSSEFGVSEVTIRRDLAILEKQGLIQRTHGGAVSSVKSRFELSFEQKSRRNIEEKVGIGEKALALIEDGDTIMLDSGTTTYQLAKLLGSKKDLTVITNSINMVPELSVIPNIILIVLGGLYKPATGAAIGPLTTRYMEDMHVDKFFIGCNAITINGGLMTADINDAETRRAMINSAAQVIVLADSSKFGKTSFISVAPIGQIDVVISDNKLDWETVNALRERGLEVILV